MAAASSACLSGDEHDRRIVCTWASRTEACGRVTSAALHDEATAPGATADVMRPAAFEPGSCRRSGFFTVADIVTQRPHFSCPPPPLAARTGSGARVSPARARAQRARLRSGLDTRAQRPTLPARGGGHGDRRFRCSFFGLDQPTAWLACSDTGMGNFRFPREMAVIFSPS